MKTIRLFSVALAMLFAMGANAQIFKDGHFVGNFNIGGVTGKGGFSKAAFGIGLGYQTRELYKHLSTAPETSTSWDSRRAHVPSAPLSPRTNCVATPIWLWVIRWDSGASGRTHKLRVPSA